MSNFFSAFMVGGGIFMIVYMMIAQRFINQIEMGEFADKPLPLYPQTIDAFRTGKHKIGYWFFIIGTIIAFFRMENETTGQNLSYTMGLFFWIWIGLLVFTKSYKGDEATTKFQNIIITRKAIGHCVYMLLILSALTLQVDETDGTSDHFASEQIETKPDYVDKSVTTFPIWHAQTEENKRLMAFVFAEAMMKNDEEIEINNVTLPYTADYLVGCLNEIPADSILNFNEIASGCYVIMKAGLK